MEGADLVRALQEVEMLLASLHKIGSYYATPVGVEPSPESIREYERETTRFVDEWKVTSRLAAIRNLLSKPFDTTLGDDDMDDLERAMQDLDCWENPKSTPK